MEKTNNKLPLTLSLETKLTSYNTLFIGLFVLIIGVIILYIVNPNGFNKTFGNEIFITVPILFLLLFLIEEVTILKNTPDKSLLSLLPWGSEPGFFYAMIALIVLIGIGGFFSMLAVAGIFSDKPPENNTAMILNLVIVMLFISIFSYIYNRSRNNDNNVLYSLPPEMTLAFELRNKYTFIFIGFCFLVMLLYFVNPGNIMTTYATPSIFLLLFFGLLFVIMITIYQYFLANPSKGNLLKDVPTPLTFIIKGGYIAIALLISYYLIYGSLKIMGIFNQDATTNQTWGTTIFNLLIFCAMLGIIYKLANAGGFLDKNPWYRLILNTLLYIPCLLVYLLNYLGQLFGIVKGPPGTNAFSPPTKTEINILIFSLILVGGYFLITLFAIPFFQKKYLQQGGKQLINQPVTTDILTNITSYESLDIADKIPYYGTLNEADKYNYQNGTKFSYEYAISFWFYIDSFPPSTNASYSKIVPILSYGDNPAVKYSSQNNTLYITVKQGSETISIIDSIHSKENEIQTETINKWKNVQEQIKTSIEDVKLMPFGNDIDADGNRIIYKHPNVLLQKWNQIVLNYSGGTLDVFYNGKLVKSAIEVVPYMKMDMLTVGTKNGISGNIANLIYFNNPLDIVTINTLYTSLKDKNPPCIPENKDKVFPFV
jgi:hypothetical protein